MIAWDQGTAVTGDGMIVGSFSIARLHLTAIPSFLGASDNVPPRYYRLGTIGWTRDGARTQGQSVVYADQIVELDADRPDGIYYALTPGVSGILYRGVDIMADAQPAAHVCNSANITLANNVETALGMDTDVTDPFNMHNAATNPARITVPIPGWYTCVANVVFNSNAVGYRAVRLYKNGAIQFVGESTNPVAGQTHQVNVSGLLYLSAGDYVEVYALQTSGGNLDVVASGIRTPSLAVARTGG